MLIAWWRGLVSPCCGGLLFPAGLWVLSSVFWAEMGTKKAWGRESQRTPGEWNFRNGESVVPAWSSCLGPDGGVYATPFSWPVHGSPTPCSISVPFLPEGLFYCTFKILLLFFFPPCTKYWLMLLMAVGWLYMLIILPFKLDHFYVGFYFKPE